MPRGVPIRRCEKCQRQYRHGEEALWTLHYDDDRRLSFWLCWRATCRAVGGDRLRRLKFVNDLDLDRRISHALGRVTLASGSSVLEGRKVYARINVFTINDLRQFYAPERP